MPLPSEAAAKLLIVFNELWLNTFPVDLPLIRHMNYVCYLCAVKVETFPHSVVSRLRRKPVFYGLGETRQISGGSFVCVWSDSGEALGCQCLLKPESWAPAGVFFKEVYILSLGTSEREGRLEWVILWWFFSCCCFLLRLFNSAESPSSSTVRPHSGLRWPNSPLLLSKRPIFVSFERCPSGQRSLSLGCLESSPGETKTEIILNPGQVPPLPSEAKLTPHKMKSNQLVTWEPPWGVLQLDFSRFGHRPKSQWKLRVTGFLCRDAGSSVDLVMF